MHAYLGARATSERSIGRPGWMGGRQIKSNAIVVSREGSARLTPSPPSLNMRKMPPAKEKGCNATATKTSSAQHKLTKRTLSFSDRAGTPTLTLCITTPIDYVVTMGACIEKFYSDTLCPPLLKTSSFSCRCFLLRAQLLPSDQSFHHSGC